MSEVGRKCYLCRWEHVKVLFVCVRVDGNEIGTVGVGDDVIWVGVSGVSSVDLVLLYGLIIPLLK